MITTRTRLYLSGVACAPAALAGLGIFLAWIALYPAANPAEWLMGAAAAVVVVIGSIIGGRRAASRVAAPVLLACWSLLNCPSEQESARAVDGLRRVAGEKVLGVPLLPAPVRGAIKESLDAEAGLPLPGPATMLLASTLEAVCKPWVDFPEFVALRGKQAPAARL